MTYTLFEAILELAKVVGDVFEGVASGGSTTTLVDADIPTTFPNDHFNNGTIFFVSGNNANKSAILSDYASATTTFTFPTQSGACAASDQYAVADSDYPRHLLVQAINRALVEIGEVASEDTSLTTVEDQQEYTLPAGVYNVKELYIASETSSPYDYVPNYNWIERGGKIIFDDSYIPEADGYTIKVVYNDPAGTLDDDSDTISDYIFKDLLAWKAAVHCLRWRMQRTKEDEPHIKQLLNEALTMAERKMVQYPVRQAVKFPKHSRL